MAAVGTASVNGTTGGEGTGDRGDSADGGGVAAGAKPALRVDVADQEAVAGSIGAAVSVVVSTDVAEEALIVPVTALLALAEGGYAVERVTRGDEVELVGVEIGLIAEARVQVVSEGLEAGDKVRIP